MSKVLLGMSGGTDSTYAAWLLKRDAHEVVGVTFRFHDSPLRAAAIERAQKTAELLDIDHHVIDMREIFYEKVKKATVRQFSEGLFSNPCTFCSREVKIPALFEQAETFGCDMVATGHYASITTDTAGFELLPYQLRVPLDKHKDQTFLLYTLNQEELAHLIFPLNDMTKGEVRRDVMRAGLLKVAPVNDGQGEPCFFNGASYVNWLEGEGGLAPDTGDIIYVGDRSVVGGYEAQYRYAPDQSLGVFPITREIESEDASSEELSSEQSDEELFAIFKDTSNRRILAGTRALAGSEMVMLRDVHWTSIEEPTAKRSCRARIAYNKKPFPAQLIVRDGQVIVAFNERVMGVRPGQPIVLYSDSLILGGGIVVG